MAQIFTEKGCPLDKQRFTWRDLVQKPISKLDDDTYTRIRIILMNGIEQEALRFSHACARMNRELQLPLAQVRRCQAAQLNADRAAAAVRVRARFELDTWQCARASDDCVERAVCAKLKRAWSIGHSNAHWHST
jgi:hypothetical protein